MDKPIQMIADNCDVCFGPTHWVVWYNLPPVRWNEGGSRKGDMRACSKHVMSVALAADMVNVKSKGKIQVRKVRP